MNKLILLLVGALAVASASSIADEESNKVAERELASAPVYQAAAQVGQETRRTALRSLHRLARRRVLAAVHRVRRATSAALRSYRLEM
jgi:hypothetical protein